MTYIKACLLYLISLCLSATVFAAASVLIWPIDPVLEDYQNASAIWLENKGQETVYFQVRVLDWQQENNEDKLSSQKDITVSPPFALIKPNEKQLIRLVRTPSAKLPEGSEKAYRILVDEIPKKDTDTNQDKKITTAGLQFQMRYSVPLFSSGKNVWTKEDYENKRAPETVSLPKLSYRLIDQKNQQWLEIHNSGSVHARISNITNKSTVLMNGLVGYVLPSSTMRWAIPKQHSIKGSEQISAQVNNEKQPMNLIKESL
ncbi:fimbrial biogenesis chaperone [Neisseria sp. Ec49-e6-T10]|uniref:fimbrial biogenesis chaperone n=1 Tax=Neisseria sp. Ec49-e6-T10 TaxID=3140744 RepID=UPI003EB6B07C